MLTKKDLTEHGFNDIVQYFMHIEVSAINGQSKQVHELIKALSKEQKKRFLGYLLINLLVKDTEEKQMLVFATIDKL